MIVLLFALGKHYNRLEFFVMKCPCSGPESLVWKRGTCSLETLSSGNVTNCQSGYQHPIDAHGNVDVAVKCPCGSPIRRFFDLTNYGVSCILDTHCQLMITMAVGFVIGLMVLLSIPLSTSRIITILLSLMDVSELGTVEFRLTIFNGVLIIVCYAGGKMVYLMALIGSNIRRTWTATENLDQEGFTGPIIQPIYRDSLISRGRNANTGRFVRKQGNAALGPASLTNN